MDLDNWVVGRTEEVVLSALGIVGRPEDDAFWIMADTMGQNSGLLRLLKMMSIFYGIEGCRLPEEEAREFVEEFRLLDEEPLGTIEDVAHKVLITWCLYFFELLGQIHVASDSAEGTADLSGLIIRVDDDGADGLDTESN